MTLLELLVQELPKRGGWPEGVNCISTHADGMVFHDGSIQSYRFNEFCLDGWKPGKEHGYTNAVSKNQYEAALAASKQPEWDGEGRPPVGVTCEHRPGDGTTENEWEAVTVLGISERPDGIFTDFWLRKEDGSSYIVRNAYRFRPIRTEAERKREEAAKSMLEVIESQKHRYTENAYMLIYDAIAAGKIPGVKLAD